MENTLFSCTTHDLAQLVWMQMALTHFDSENSGSNSSMAIMECRRRGLLQGGSSFAFAVLTHSHLFCRISFRADSVTSSINLLHCFPATSTKRFSLLSGFPMFSSDVPSPIWSSVTSPALGPEASILGSPTCCSPFYKGTTGNSACNSVFLLFCS